MYTIKEVLNSYKEVESNDLNSFNAFHIYDTGERCIEDNSGYHCARHMIIKAFDFDSKEMANFGRHDAISFDNTLVEQVMIWEDGSFYIEFTAIQEVEGWTQRLRVRSK